jgi:hypothetical protein
MSKFLNLATTLGLIAAFAGQTAYSQGNKKPAPKQQIKQNTGNNANKPKTSKTPEKPKRLTIEDLRGGPGIYIYEGGGVKKNDIVYNKPDYAYTNSLFVSNNNVYIAGSKEYNEKYYATLWINGKSQQLDVRPSSALAVYVHNENIYVFGYVLDKDVGQKYILWENGNVRETPFEKYSSESYYDMYVFNNDVYVLKVKRSGYQEAELWKTGINEIKILWKGEQRLYRKGFFISDNILYRAEIKTGRNNFTIKLTKDGEKINEYDLNASLLYDLVLTSNQDIYITTDQGLFKNSEKIAEIRTIVDPEDYDVIPTKPLYVSTINDDVFVIAKREGYGVTTRYSIWKNNTMKTIGDFSTTTARSIKSAFVVEGK